MDTILVEKDARRLTFLRDAKAVWTCAIGLGVQPLGHKTREGDGRTPEGTYYVCTKNRKSKFHLALGVSYPNARDALSGFDEHAINLAELTRIERAQQTTQRPPWDTALGGFIMIHGGGASDWTQGCIALADHDIETLFALAQLGTTIEIVP